MPTQDKDTEMAIPSQPRKLARKLMQIDLTPYAMGRAAKEVTKKFTAKHPVEVSDYPADDAESNNARFKGGKVNKDNTRKADYKTGGDENAYESVIKRKLIEKFVAKISNAKIAEAAEMSDAAHELSLHADNDRHLYRNSHVPVAKNLEKKFKKGSYDHEKAKKLWGYHADRAAQSYSKQHGDVKTPWHKMFTTADRKQAASHMADKHQAEMDAGNFHSENVEWNDIPALNETTAFTYIAELGEPMSPAPATSDNPGFSGDSAMATDNGADNEKTNNSGDEENETVNGVREKLENIAMMSAEMFENLQDDTELEKHVIEKLELAHNFIEAVSKEINDSKSDDDEEEDEPEGNQGGKDDNNIAKPSAFKGNGEQSMAKEDVNVNEMMHDPMADGGKYAKDEMRGREATGGPLDPPKKKNKTARILARKAMAMKTFATKKGA
jgi:nuclear transport factor 2 (NTF2) superfamily protein